LRLCLQFNTAKLKNSMVSRSVPLTYPPSA
jgi:hypothetical protein